MTSQSPKAGHGYSDLHRVLSNKWSFFSLNPLKRVMGILMLSIYSG